MTAQMGKLDMQAVVAAALAYRDALRDHRFFTQPVVDAREALLNVLDAPSEGPADHYATDDEMAKMGVQHPDLGLTCICGHAIEPGPTPRGCSACGRMYWWWVLVSE